MYKKECFTEIIQRQKIISLLYKPIEKINGLNSEQLNEILKLYPSLKEIFEAIESFRNIFNYKDETLLYTWLNKVEKHPINELASFASGIRRDIKAVRNAIITDINNGLAEGTINKIKVIKRIMYGRCKFDLLKKKSICLQHI